MPASGDRVLISSLQYLIFAAMSLKIYNSISGTKETFHPILEGRVGMYVCGPTVYNDVHIGNCRTFVSFDVIYRYLLFLGKP